MLHIALTSMAFSSLLGAVEDRGGDAGHECDLLVPGPPSLQEPAQESPAGFQPLKALR